jgi:hypothetical protein
MLRRLDKTTRRRLFTCSSASDKSTHDVWGDTSKRCITHGVNHRLGDILIELRQLRRAAAGTIVGCGDQHPLSRQMLGKGLARWPLAFKRLTVTVRAAAFSTASSSSVAAASRYSSCNSVCPEAEPFTPSGCHRVHAATSRSQVVTADQCFRVREVCLGISHSGACVDEFDIGFHVSRSVFSTARKFRLELSMSVGSVSTNRSGRPPHNVHRCLD